MRRCFLFLLLLTAVPGMRAQERMFRFNYENDFFSATDYYFTQGVRMEFTFPLVRKIPLTKALLHFRNGRDAYGFSFNQRCYTPTSIREDRILYGDRPFAGALFIGFHRVSVDSSQQQELRTELDLGGVGPCSSCEETQESIHTWLKNIYPHGWQFQLHNGPLISYRATYEKGWMALHHADFSTWATAEAGTLTDAAAFGMTLRMGRIPPRFGMRREKQFYAWLFASGGMRVVAYDATLQGAVFSRDNPYVIAAADMERLVHRGDFGVVVMYRRLRLEYSKTYISQEFRGGLTHSWGLAGIGVLF